jgi:uridine kinase
MNCTIIGIAGGTASGKTTLARKLYESTKKVGSVSILRFDDYYYKMDHLTYEERCKINYDHPDSFDVELLISHLQELKKGNPIDKPTYDYVIHNRAKETELINPSNVIIVEGILIFAIPALREMFDVKIFVDTPDDIRLLRRLKRDVEDRGRTIESVSAQYLETVRPMHEAFVEPSKKYADLIIPEGGKNQIALDFIETKIIQLLNK